MSSRVATLIHNPTAGDGRPTRKDIERILADAGFQVRYQSTKGNWRKAVAAARDLIVAAGGDGTVGKVFRGGHDSDVLVALLPMGTANNLARSLGQLGDARDLVAGWDLNAPEPFDVWVMRRVGGKRERLFVESCGGGLFVQAIERGPLEVEQGAAFVGGEIDRALTMLQRIVDNARPVKWNVEIDGKDQSGEYIAVEAMNIRLTGPGIPLAVKADPGDGLLDVALVDADQRAQLHDYIEQRLAHEQHEPPKVRTVRGKHIVLEPPGPTIRVDDDLVRVRRPIEMYASSATVNLARARNSN